MDARKRGRCEPRGSLFTFGFWHELGDGRDRLGLHHLQVVVQLIPLRGRQLEALHQRINRFPPQAEWSAPHCRIDPLGADQAEQIDCPFVVRPDIEVLAVVVLQFPAVGLRLFLGIWRLVEGASR
jgi:hypothetical protein